MNSGLFHTKKTNNKIMVTLVHFCLYITAYKDSIICKLGLERIFKVGCKEMDILVLRSVHNLFLFHWFTYFKIF